MARLDLTVDTKVKGKDQLANLAKHLGMGDEKAKQFSKTLGPIVPALGAVGIGMGAVAAKDFLVGAIQQAGQFEDALAASETVLGKQMVPELEKWAEGAADAFGASKREALEQANLMGGMAKSAGLLGEEAAKFGTDMVELGGDLASMYGGTTKQAVEAVGSALRGEAEPIRKYNVQLNDAVLRQRAFEMGLIDTVKKGLTPQQKVLAAQQEILAQTTDAQGDYIRNQDGMTNSLKTTQAELDNLTTDIGTALLPIVADLLGLVSDGIGIFRDFGEATQPVSDALGSVSDAGVAANQFLVELFGETSEAQVAALEKQEAAWESYQESTASGTVYISDALRASESNWQAYQETVSLAAAGVATAIPEAITDHWDEIRAAGTESVAAYNVGIFEAQDSLNSEVDALLAALDARLEPGEEIARLRGQKMQLELAKSIHENDQPALDAIDATIENINRQLNALNGYGAGRNLVVTLANGIRENLGTASLASYALANSIRGPVFIESEPKDPNSPLRGITKIGGNIVDTITGGIYGALGGATGASRALAGALSPGLIGGSFLGSAGGSGDVHYHNHTHLEVQGNLVARNTAEAEDALMRASRFHAVGGNG